MNYNSDQYPKDLLYEITAGIMQNQWKDILSTFLAIPSEMLEGHRTDDPGETIHLLKYQNMYNSNSEFYYTYPTFK